MGFQTPQYRITDLLAWAESGVLQLPDFQREYRWEDSRIRDLLVTIVRGHPMGVLMVLQTGNGQVRFKPKPITGAPAAQIEPKYLLLDGQQRMTSMYQSLTGTGVVHTKDARGKSIDRRYFLDVEKALGDPGQQDEAVLSLPADGVLHENIGRDIKLDVSTRDKQLEQGIIPFSTLLGPSATAWLLAFTNQVPSKQSERIQIFTNFNNEVLSKVQAYEIPAIELDSSTTKEAVATVFEKVNTGGLPLNTFELLTATFAGDAQYFHEHGKDFRLGDDWMEVQKIIEHHPVLTDFAHIDYLQAVTLLASNARKAAFTGTGRPPAVTARRVDVLRIDLREFLTWAPKVRQALAWVANFYTSLNIVRSDDLPYRTQTVPLIVMRVLLGNQIDYHPVRERIDQWYWCGVFGELYGSTTETRFARDVEQTPGWANAASTGESIDAPITVREANLVESRLLSLRTRNSAAYKGIYALLMKREPKDWMLDQNINQKNYIDMQVDIHHIFPKLWCDQNHIDNAIRDSVVNKTPLAKSTNIFLRGDSPAKYIPRLEKKTNIDPGKLDEILRAHLIDPALLRAADFHGFFETRREALIGLVEDAMGKTVFRDVVHDAQDKPIGDEDATAFDTDDFGSEEFDEPDRDVAEGADEGAGGSRVGSLLP